MEEDLLNNHAKLIEDSRQNEIVMDPPGLEGGEEQDDDEGDILDGYLAYDMSEFQGMIGQNLDFQIDDFSDSFSSENNENDQPQIIENGQHIASPQPQVVPQPPSFNMSDHSTQEVRQSASDYRRQTMPTYPQPIIEGDEVDPDIDIDIEPPNFDDHFDEDLEIDNEEDDLNLFDSIDDQFDDENADPYQILIRYPNEEYKVSIFCPKHSDYGLDKKGSQMILRNSELLSEAKEMDAFYRYLRKLGLQRELNTITIEDHIRQDQLITINHIAKKFEEMRDLQQKWLEVSPTYTFSGRLQTFAVQLERFMDMVKYIFEFSAGKASGRRFLHGRKGFYFIANDAPNKQQSKQQQNSFPQNQIPQSHNINDVKNILHQQQLINYTEQPMESASLSVIFFKAVELYQLFQHFLHIRKESDKYKYVINIFLNNLKIRECIYKIKSRYKIYKLIKKKVKIVKRINQKSAHNSSAPTPLQQNQDLFTQTTSEFFEFITSNVKLMGLPAIFEKLTYQVNLENSRLSSVEKEKAKISHQSQQILSNQNKFLIDRHIIFHQKYKYRKNSLLWKYEANNYLSQYENEDNLYF